MDASGNLAHIQGADWKLEIAALSEVAFQQTRRRPALLFDDIKGYPRGYRMLTNPIGSSEKLALTLGLPAGLTDLQVVDELRRRLSTLQPIPPTFVQSGPVFENTRVGDEVDLWQFPAPLWHEHDGGRYIGAGDMVVTRDLDDGWVNAANYRVMVHDRNTVGVFVAHNGQLGYHTEKYHRRSEPCPVAICVGIDPLLFLAAVSDVPNRICEFDWVGGMRGAPIELVTGPYTGLPFPAHAEIVLEGEILPEQRDEGPYGEFTGYYSSAARPQPITRIKAVHYRNDPIMLGVALLRPPSEHSSMHTRPALIWNALERAGVPDVKGVWTHGGNARFFVVVAVHQRYPGHSKQVGALVSQLPISFNMNRYVVVVDDDIDITDPQQVIWAMSTRCDPEQQIDLVRRAASSVLDPAMSPTRGNSLNSRLIIDACRPFERLKDFPRVISMPPEVKAEVMRRYGELLAQW